MADVSTQWPLADFAKKVSASNVENIRIITNVVLMNNQDIC